ncbi:hypothetical protein [Jiulongibacter sediminis]|uniref:hypothetical protein n=1 Tax=Jiulongibacter sediminis TaxID=1605367 RepID=UPI0006DCC41E|nr:hypothetical protein [Jiulongibacter sediminis]
MNSIKKNTQLVFLTSLTLLILNDFYFKQTFHNTITGKLSDFAGLLIFPWFWSLFFKQSRRLIYVGTAALFVLWKSELSTTSISTINEFLGTSFNRVVDLTDLLALSVLPFSYKLSEKSGNQINKYSFQFKYLISGLSIFSFLATSQPEFDVSPNWEFEESYILPFNKEELLTKHMRYKYGGTPPASILAQSEFDMEYEGGTYRFLFRSSVIEIDSSNSWLTLKELKSYSIGGQGKRDELQKATFLQLFEKEVIDYLRVHDSNLSAVSFSP